MHWVSIVLNEWLRCISTNEAPNQPSCYQINQGENKIRAQEEKLDQQIGPKYLSLRHFLSMGRLLFNQLLLLIIHTDKYKSYNINSKETKTEISNIVLMPTWDFVFLCPWVAVSICQWQCPFSWEVECIYYLHVNGS